MNRLSSPMLDVRTARKIGSPLRPTTAYDSSVVAAMRSGGWGFWYGLGTAHTSWNWKYLPSYVNPSSVPALRRISRLPSNRARVLLTGTFNHVERPARPP